MINDGSHLGLKRLFCSALNSLAVDMCKPNFPHHIACVARDLNWLGITPEACRGLFQVIASQPASVQVPSSSVVGAYQFRLLIVATMYLQHLTDSRSREYLSRDIQEISIEFTSSTLSEGLKLLCKDRRITRHEAAYINNTRGCASSDLNDPRLASLSRAA